MLSSCSNYYKAITASEPVSSGKIEDLKMKNSYFILRDGSKAFAMNNISFSSDGKDMLCILDSLPYDHKLHLRNGRNGKMKYRDLASTGENESAVLNEVHLYISQNGNTENGPSTISLAGIKKIEILEKDKARTNKSFAIGTTITVTAFAAVLVAILSTIKIYTFSL